MYVLGFFLRAVHWTSPEDVLHQITVNWLRNVGISYWDDILWIYTYIFSKCKLKEMGFWNVPRPRSNVSEWVFVWAVFRKLAKMPYLQIFLGAARVQQAIRSSIHWTYLLCLFYFIYLLLCVRVGGWDEELWTGLFNSGILRLICFIYSVQNRAILP